MKYIPKKVIVGDGDPKNMHLLDDGATKNLHFFTEDKHEESSSYIQRKEVDGKITWWFEIQNYFRKDFDKVVQVTEHVMGLPWVEKHYTSNPFSMCWGFIYCDRFYEACIDCSKIIGIFSHLLVKPKMEFKGHDVPKDRV